MACRADFADRLDFRFWPVATVRLAHCHVGKFAPRFQISENQATYRNGWRFQAAPLWRRACCRRRRDSLLVANRPVAAADQVHDEIQTYNAEIAGIGQWTYEQHLNFAAIGQTQPEFPGGFTSNHSLQGTPEFAYGITKWWEAGFYLPFAVNGSGEFLSDGAKIRSLFVVPDAAKRDFFYGINFELGYEPPQFSLSRWNMEI